MGALTGNWYIYSVDLWNNPNEDQIKIDDGDTCIFDNESISFTDTGQPQHGKPYYEGKIATRTVGVQILEGNRLLFGHVLDRDLYSSAFVGLLNPIVAPSFRALNMSIFYRPETPYSRGTLRINRDNHTTSLDLPDGRLFLRIASDEEGTSGICLSSQITAGEGDDGDELITRTIQGPSPIDRPICIGFHWKSKADFNGRGLLGPAGSQFCTSPIIGNVDWA